MLTRKSSSTTVNFMPPGVWVLILGRGLSGCKVLMNIMVKIIFFTSTQGKIEFLILYTRKPSTKTVDFIQPPPPPKVGVVTLGRGKNDLIVLMQLFLKEIIFLISANA